jgi:multidrug resistance efflux pump
MDNTIQQAEEKILKTVAQAEEKIEAAERGILKNKWVRSGSLAVFVAILAGGLLYWQIASTRVGIDTSIISSPIIGLSPSAPGQLQEVYVHEGDMVTANKPVAKVGDEIIKTKIAGEIVNVDMEIGKTFNPGQAVVSMIDPGQLKVVGTIDENKGLDKIRIGQLASFTVDAFGSKTYYGAVDEVSPSSKQTDVVFNISSSRPVNQFDIKVRFDQNAYPEIKNGMSAKLTIFTK